MLQLEWLFQGAEIWCKSICTKTTMHARIGTLFFPLQEACLELSQSTTQHYIGCLTHVSPRTPPPSSFGPLLRQRPTPCRQLRARHPKVPIINSVSHVRCKEWNSPEAPPTPVQVTCLPPPSASSLILRAPFLCTAALLQLTNDAGLDCWCCTTRHRTPEPRGAMQLDTTRRRLGAERLPSQDRIPSGRQPSAASRLLLMVWPFHMATLVHGSFGCSFVYSPTLELLAGFCSWSSPMAGSWKECMSEDCARHGGDLARGCQQRNASGNNSATVVFLQTR